MKAMPWFERSFTFGLPAAMMPFYLERLDGTIARLHQKVTQVPEELLSQKFEGKWSVKENIGHLADVDIISGKRISELKDGAEILSPAVIQPQSSYNDSPVRSVLEYFALNRTANLKRFQSLSEVDKQKFSMHPRLKVRMSAVDLAWFDAEHDDHHLVRINEIRAALS